MNDAHRYDPYQSRVRADGWLLRGAVLLCGALWLVAAAQFCAVVVLLIDANVYGEPAQGALVAVCVIGAALDAWLALWLRAGLRLVRRRQRTARPSRPARLTVRDAIAAVPHSAPDAPASAPPQRTG